MKLQDPSRQFAHVVSSRRTARAGEVGERFRLGLHGLECGSSASRNSRSAVIGASAWALKAEQIEDTVGIIGLVGGLLADLGLTVCPVGADGARSARPALVVWVCGDETRADEYDQLEAIGSPGVSIGACVDRLDDWDAIELAAVRDPHQFVHEFVDTVNRRLGTRGDVDPS